jgi:hypothetical protein
MWCTGLAVAIVLVLWLLAELKTSRPDGDVIKVHPYRRMLTFIMPRRNDSTVYFDSAVDAERLLAYLDKANEKYGAHITHAVVAACAVALAENPSMNRFEKGGRLYQRRDLWLTFSMKRKKLDRKAKLSAVKLKMSDEETFAEFCGRVNSNVKVERSGQQTAADKEFALFSAFPRPLLRLSVFAASTLDYFNLLPAFFIEGDAMFTSMFVANLGSLHMGAGYHHLYEWGTCPLFAMVGEVEERPVVRDGKVVVRKILPIRYTYDERIDDGLNARFGIESAKRVLENPETELGCIAEDGSDVHPLGATPEPE